jgi:hypothetical protein
MIIIQPYDTEDEHDDENPFSDGYGYGRCVTNIRESDML